MVELLLLQAIPQINGVTFHTTFHLIHFFLIITSSSFFLTDIVKYPCFSTSPENLLPVFVGLWEIISGYVSLHFPAFALVDALASEVAPLFGSLLLMGFS